MDYGFNQSMMDCGFNQSMMDYVFNQSMMDYVFNQSMMDYGFNQSMIDCGFNLRALLLICTRLKNIFDGGKPRDSNSITLRVSGRARAAHVAAPPASA